MKSTIKKISDTKTEAKVVLSADDLKKAREIAVEGLSKNIKVQGFRQGKAPAHLVAQQLSPNEIATKTIETAIRIYADQAFVDEKRPIIAIEKVEITKYVPDETAEYTAIAEVMPEIKLGDFRKLKVKPPKSDVSDAEVEEIVDNIVTAYAEKSVVTRAARKGDEVIIDFVGKKDGEAFKGGTAKDYRLGLGSGQFIPGFEEGIIGHETGDKFDLPLTFPEDYGEKTLAGQPVVFEILLKQVDEVVEPSKNDELAAKCGPFKTMDDLRADIRKNIEQQKQYRDFEKYRDELVKELVSKSKISAPQILVQDQLRFIQDDINRNAAAHGLSFEQYLSQTGQTEEEWRKAAEELATERVKASLVLQVFAQQENITTSDEEVEAKIAELRDVYQKSKEALKNLQKPAVRQDIRHRLLIDKALDLLVEVNSSNKPAATKKKATAKKTTEKKTSEKKTSTKKPKAKSSDKKKED